MFVATVPNWTLSALNIAPTLVPAAVAPATIAREIIPTMSPYSREFDPLLSLKSRTSIVNTPTGCLVDVNAYE